MISVVFFGSFQQYSVEILKKLHQHPDIELVGVITTPPRPGNHGVITATLVQQYATEQNLPLFALENLDQIPPIKQPDFIIVAGYGKLIPPIWLKFPKYMSINFHPSLLPDYAGRFPIEWALLRGETETGVSLIKMSEKFDQGDLISQQTIPILPNDTKTSLYTTLYNLGGDLIPETLPMLISNQICPLPQSGTGFYARQLTKEDGFLGDFDNIENKIKALNPWPGVWTYVYDKNKSTLKMKVFSITKNNQKIELENVQIEGKKPTLWSQISMHYSLTK